MSGERQRAHVDALARTSAAAGGFWQDASAKKWRRARSLSGMAAVAAERPSKRTSTARAVRTGVCWSVSYPGGIWSIMAQVRASRSSTRHAELPARRRVWFCVQTGQRSLRANLAAAARARIASRAGDAPRHEPHVHGAGEPRRRAYNQPQDDVPPQRITPAAG